MKELIRYNNVDVQRQTVYVTYRGLGREAPEFLRTGEGGTIVTAAGESTSSSTTWMGGLMGLWGVCSAVSPGSGGR